jgi:hypothetical protein
LLRFLDFFNHPLKLWPEHALLYKNFPSLFFFLPIFILFYFIFSRGKGFRILSSLVTTLVIFPQRLLIDMRNIRKQKGCAKGRGRDYCAVSAFRES